MFFSLVVFPVFSYQEFDPTDIEGSEFFFYVIDLNNESNVEKFTAPPENVVEENGFFYYNNTYQLDTCFEEGPYSVAFFSGFVDEEFMEKQWGSLHNEIYCDDEGLTCRSEYINFYNSRDRSQESCECINEVFKSEKNWLGSDLYVNPSETNNCCGNNPKIDSGFFNSYDNKLQLCVMNPDGSFEWVFSDGYSQFGASSRNKVKGNTYSIYDNSYYEEQFNTIGTIEDVEIQKPSHIRYDILVDEDKFYICEDGEYDIKGISDVINGAKGTEIISVSPSSDPVRIVGLGNIVHEYVCVNDYGMTRFVECRGDSLSYNTNAVDVGSGWIWNAKSLSFKDSIYTLYDFESKPVYATSEFYVDDTIENYADLQIVSSKVFQGSRALKIKLDRNTEIQYAGSFFAENITIPDWRNAYLQGNIFYEEFMPLTLQITYDDNGQEKISEYDLEEYIISSINPQEWNTFRIPVNFNNVKKISFIFDTYLFNYKEKQSYVSYLDNIVLIPEQKTNYYCGKILNEDEYVEYNFYKDLDLNEDACNGLFTYTGTKCCGDDAREFYTDEKGACWDNEGLLLGQRFEPITLTLLSNTGEMKELKAICDDSSESCSYILPKFGRLTKNITLVNTYNDYYDAYFESTGTNYTTNSQDVIKVDMHIYEFMIKNNVDGKIGYCGKRYDYFANEYGADIFFNNNPASFTESSSEDDSCKLDNLAYCAEDLGWTSKIRAERKDGSSGNPLDDDGAGDFPTLEEFNTYKTVPDEFLDKVSVKGTCCPNEYCWNGSLCIENEIDEPFRKASFLQFSDQGYRCIDGEWERAILKYSADGFITGYCPEDDQCLVSDRGNYSENGELFGNPQCVSTDEFVGDYLCDSGIWDSRTKILAKKMVDAVQSSDFSLFCDSYENAVNYKDMSFKGKKVLDYLYDFESCGVEIEGFPGIPCFNNFCILNSPDGVVFGTTLNTEINDSETNIQEFFQIPDISSCVRDEGGLLKCSSEQKEDIFMNWYYDTDYKILMNSEFSLKVSNNFFSTLIQNIKHWLYGDLQEEFDFSFDDIEDHIDLNNLDHEKRINRFYLMRKNSKSIVAINGMMRDYATEKKYNYIGAQFFNFQFNEDTRRGVCDYAASFNNKADYHITCSSNTEDGQSNFLFIISDKQVNVWDDVTSKLRIE